MSGTDLPYVLPPVESESGLFRDPRAGTSYAMLLCLGLSYTMSATEQGGTDIGNGGTDIGNGGTDIGNGGTDVGNGGTDIGNGGTDVGNGGTDVGNGGTDIGNVGTRWTL
eukprot:3281104-Rhodomonas_salina.1